MTASAEELLEVARRAAAQVVEPLIDARFTTELAVETKTSATDLVTAMDRWIEATLVDVLTSERPDDGIVGEEGANVASRSGVEWVIDPIDGTTNFVRDLPGYSISIAARAEGEELAALVVDPIRNEWFEATLGGGAFCNGQRLSVSAPSRLAQAIVATGFSYQPEVRAEQAALLTTVLPEVADIRRFGGAALDCCAVAAGRVDAYYERELKDWDIAAGALLVREAGGITVDLRADNGPFVAASPEVVDALLTILGRSR